MRQKKEGDILMHVGMKCFSTVLSASECGWERENEHGRIQESEDAWDIPAQFMTAKGRRVGRDEGMMMMVQGVGGETKRGF